MRLRPRFGKRASAIRLAAAVPFAKMELVDDKAKPAEGTSNFAHAASFLGSHEALQRARAIVKDQRHGLLKCSQASLPLGSLQIDIAAGRQKLKQLSQEKVDPCWGFVGVHELDGADDLAFLDSG